MGVWTPLGTVIRTGNGDEEPNVAYTTTDSLIVGNPCWQIWYSNSNIMYRESKDGLGWGVGEGSGRVMTALNSRTQSCVTKAGSTYYLTCPTNDHQQIDIFSSSSPTGFSLLHSAIITVGSAGAWDDISVHNTSLVIEGTIGSGGTAYIMYEAKGSAHSDIFAIGLASSTDLVTWTKAVNNPILGAGVYAAHPDMHHVNGTWYAWVGKTFNSLKRIQSSAFDAVWTDPGYTTFQASTVDETAQTADDFLIELNGKTYLFYTGIATGIPSHLKVAVANMTMAQLVATSEGMNRAASLALGSVSVSGNVTMR